METLNKFSGLLALVAVVIAIGLIFKPIHVTVEIPASKAFGSGINSYTNLSMLNVDDTGGNSFIVDTNSLLVDATNNRIGLSTSTPGASLSFGKTGTTTILFAGVPCFAIPTTGSGSAYIYMWPATSSAAQVAGGGYSAGGWATSTTACYATP